MTTRSREVTSSCGTVLRSDFLKNIQGWEFRDFSENMQFQKSANFPKIVKILFERFWENDSKNCFWKSFYRSIPLFTGNEWIWLKNVHFRMAVHFHSVTTVYFFVRFFSLWKGYFSFWILKRCDNFFFEIRVIRNFFQCLIFEVCWCTQKMDVLGFVWSATWFSLSFAHIFQEWCARRYNTKTLSLSTESEGMMRSWTVVGGRCASWIPFSI